MERRRENPHKSYVKVRCDCEIGGKSIPIKFKTEDGDPVMIDRITDVRQAASTKAGGCGTRYTCMIQGREIYLFHDRNDWFIEND